MSHQLTFAEVRRSRASDPQTSKAAAAQAHGLAAEHRRLILEALRLSGGRTGHEIAATCGLTAVQVCRRLAELRDDGEIRATGETRPTPSGRAAQCWEAIR